MSKADKMFEELGYKIIPLPYRDDLISYYNYFSETEIDFCIDDKVIRIDNEKEYYLHIKELQAINKKCKELGWL